MRAANAGITRRGFLCLAAAWLLVRPLRPGAVRRTWHDPPWKRLSHSEVARRAEWAG
ncbi:MAG: hypothetical protein PHR35_18065 [Kiritimatiellae bacterium]|nr:hypothetical protein [Kiritimatiellia bacterium]